jgi:hypothetical protein
MAHYILKSKAGKFGIGAVVVFIFIVGVLWINGKQKHTEPGILETVAIKIPKSEIPPQDSSIPVEEKSELAGDAEMVIDPSVTVSKVEEKSKEGGVTTEPDSSKNAIGENRGLEKDGKVIQTKTAGYREENLPAAGQEQIVAAQAAPAREPEKDVPVQQADSETKKGLQPKANQKKEDTAIPKPVFSDTDHQELILQDIRLSENMKGKLLEVWANRTISKQKYFVLSTPPRLVIDLPGKWKKPSFQLKTVSSDLVSKIRIWRHERKLRIVCDLILDKVIKPVVTPSPNGVEFILMTE